MRRRTRLLLALPCAVLVGVPLATNLPAARMIFALAICLLLPGLGWARKMRFGDLGDTLALAIVLSICMTVAVATPMVVFSSLSIGWGLTALSAMAVAGFLPIRQLLDRARTAIRLPTPKTQNGTIAGPSPAVVTVTDPWLDWYTAVQRRAEEAAARRHRS
jgi:hypothetical protein